MKVARWSALAAAVAAAGCGSDSKPEPPPHKQPSVVSVGRPITPRFVRVLGPGWVELRAKGPGEAVRQVWSVGVLRHPPRRPRDVCVMFGLEMQDLAEGDTQCDLSVPRSGAVSFLDVPGIHDRFGPSPTLISGVAPPGILAMRLEGLGGSRSLPLSEHRAFVAVFAPGARGKVRLVSQRSDREIVRTFKLPVPPRVYMFPRHTHRRRGAVFGEEVGKPITELSYRQVVRRFGPPAVIRREHGLRCAYYEVVGYANDGWQFCFAGDGHMVSAAGNSPPPEQ